MQEVIEVISRNIWVIVSEVIVLLPIVIAGVRVINKIIEGQRCQLRADMMSTYYRCNDAGKIRQYEAEHFEACYHAYKALGGNTFIDEIYKKAHAWEVTT